MSTTPGWKRAARQPWRRWLRAYHFEDNIDRPTERAALHSLEAQAFMGERSDLPLSPVELDIWLLERQFMAEFESDAFRARFGLLSPGDKYAWIAMQRPDFVALEVRYILDDVRWALDRFAFDAAIEALLGERSAA